MYYRFQLNHKGQFYLCLQHKPNASFGHLWELLEILGNSGEFYHVITERQGM